MEAIKINHESLLSLEQPLLKVPLEVLKRTFKTSLKQIEKEISFINTNLENISTNIKTDKGARDPLPGTARVATTFSVAATAVKDKENPQTSADPAEKQKALINEMLSRLDDLKKKLSESTIYESTLLSATQARLAHLNSVLAIPTTDSEEFDRWSKTRLEHLLVDYLARKGLLQTAAKLAADSGIEELVDLDLFLDAQRIQDSLALKSCADALQWCQENKSSLKKIKSSLEFQLRLQEYIELIRDRKIIQAIQYCKKYLVPWSETHLSEIQQATALLAFDPSTTCAAYQPFFAPTRWQTLTSALVLDMLTLNALTKEPMLNLTLQAGLIALKTHSCSVAADRNVNCPICNPDTFGKLANGLPNSHHVNSSLVCRVSGRIMDESNPPLVLPNGHVYSTMALKEMNERDGVIVCPKTGNTYTFNETRKAFIS